MKRALGILAVLLLIAGGCAPGEPSGHVDTSKWPVDPHRWHVPAPRQPGAATDPVTAAGEQAMARLLELGAHVFCRSQEDGEAINVQFYDDWRGSGADLALLNDVAALGTMDLMISFRKFSPRSLADLKLRNPPRSFADLELHKPLVQLELIAAPDEMFDHLAALPPIKRLVLSDWQLTPEGCRRLVKAAPDVEDVILKPSIWHLAEPKPSKFTDAVAAEFGGLDRLKTLAIESAAITGAGLKHLSGMKSLERLVLDGCPALAKSDLAGLAGFDSLRSLEIHFPLTAGGLATLGKLDALESLHFGIFIYELHDGTPGARDDLKPADFEPLAAMTSLRDLDVGDLKYSSLGLHKRHSKMNLGDAIARAAGRMPNLRSLKLPPWAGIHAIDQQSLAVLASSTSLEELNVCVVELDDQSLERLSSMPNLRKLTLGSAPHPGKISDEGLAHLEKATGLVSLTLSCSSQVTDAGLAHLAGLTGLKELGLSGSDKIADAGLAHLARLTALEKLTLSSNAITEVGLAHLVGLDALKALNLTGTRFYGKELKMLGGLRSELAQPKELAPL